MADDDPNRERREKALEAGRAATEESKRQFAERTKGKPTPTQDENDRAALGEHLAEHEDDGTPRDEGAMPLESRQRHLEGRSDERGGYQTRQVTSAPPRTSTPGGQRPTEPTKP